MTEPLAAQQLQPRGFLSHRLPQDYQQPWQLYPGDEVMVIPQLPGYKVYIDTFRVRPKNGKVMEANEDGSYSVLVEDGRTLDFYRWELKGQIIDGPEQPQVAGEDGRAPENNSSAAGSTAGSGGGTASSEGSL